MQTRQQLKASAKANLAAMRDKGMSPEEIGRLIDIRLGDALLDVDNERKALRRAEDRRRFWEWTKAENGGGKHGDDTHS